MHMNQSLHTISKNVGLLLTDTPQLMNYLTRLFPRKSQPITICRAYSDWKISKRDSSGNVSYYFKKNFEIMDYKLL